MKHKITNIVFFIVALILISSFFNKEIGRIFIIFLFTFSFVAMFSYLIYIYGFKKEQKWYKYLFARIKEIEQKNIKYLEQINGTDRDLSDEEILIIDKKLSQEFEEYAQFLNENESINSITRTFDAPAGYVDFSNNVRINTRNYGNNSHFHKDYGIFLLNSCGRDVWEQLRQKYSYLDNL